MRIIGSVLLVAGCLSSSPATYETTPAPADESSDAFVDHRTGPPGQVHELSDAAMSATTGPVAAFEPGEPIAGDGIDLVATRLRARTYERDLLACYQAALALDPSFTVQGTATATFVVKLTGKLTAVRVVGFDAEFDACLTEKLGEMEFPPPTEGRAVRVTLPLRFYNANG
jgi:hypothetical protein